MMVLNVYYLAIKAMFFYSLVHAFVKFENLQKHWLFLALLYTAGVAGLSWVWFVAPGQLAVRGVESLARQNAGARRRLLQIAPAVRRGSHVLDPARRGDGYRLRRWLSF